MRKLLFIIVMLLGVIASSAQSFAVNPKPVVRLEGDIVNDTPALEFKSVPAEMFKGERGYAEISLMGGEDEWVVTYTDVDGSRKNADIQGDEAFFDFTIPENFTGNTFELKVEGKNADQTVSISADITVRNRPHIYFETFPHNAFFDDEITVVVNLEADTDNWDRFRATVDRDDVKNIFYDENLKQISFTHKSKRKQSRDVLRVTVFAENFLENAVNTTRSLTATCEDSIKIWEFPTTKGPIETEYLEVKSTEKETLSFETTGGRADGVGWVFQWKKDDEALAETFEPEMEISAENEDENREFTYSVNGTYLMNGQPSRYGCHYEWKVKFYAKPEMFDYEGNTTPLGESAKLIVTPKGGYDGGWRYRLLKGEEEIITTTSSPELTTLVFSEEDYGNLDFSEGYAKVSEYRIEAVNLWKNEEPWGEPITRDVDIFLYRFPSVHYVGYETTDSLRNVYSKNGINIEITLNGGFPKEWSHDVKFEMGGKVYGKDDYSIKENNGKVTITLNLKDLSYSSTDPQDCLVFITSRNNDVLVKDAKLTFVLWPEVKTGDFPGIIRMRAGDTKEIDTPSISGRRTYDNGNENCTVSFESKAPLVVTLEGDETHTALVAKADEGPSMERQAVKVECHVNVLSPAGEVWESITKTADVYVYRRPNLPSEFRIKGNGTTHTYLLTSTGNPDYVIANYVTGEVYHEGTESVVVLPGAPQDGSNVGVATYFKYDDCTVYSDWLTIKEGHQPCDWSFSPDHDSRSDVNGILNLSADEDENTAIYDLRGNRIAKPVSGHLYIRNGKKYIHQ